MNNEKYDIWTSGVNKREYKPLSSNMVVDVVVIGGGLAGIWAAYLLAKAGAKVALIEKSVIGSGATSLTTGFITQSIDTDPSSLVKAVGKVNARKIYDSHLEAIDLIKNAIEEEEIECEFTSCSNYIYANSEKEVDKLKEELPLLASIDVEVVWNEGKSFGFKNFGAIELKNQAKYHPIKFLYGLAESARKYGVDIYENTEALKIEEGKGVGVVTSRGKIMANFAIVTTYAPFERPFSLHFKKAFYTSYVFEVEIDKGLLKVGTYEDTHNPYHYLRVDKGERLDRIIVGGEDHRRDIKVNPSKSFEALEEYLKSILSSIPKIEYKINRKWRGPILESVDGLPFVGSLEKKSKIIYTTAFSGNGMTYAPIAATITRDKILGNRNYWSKIYASSRMPSIKSLLIKGKDYTGELIGAALKNSIRSDPRGKI
jgi:glycine/D-amino acid oxidase-like deaminating enzyme